MSLILPTNVIETIQKYVATKGYIKPKFDITSGSKNGDSYSGDVYRIVVTPNIKDVEDCQNNNTQSIITEIPTAINLIAKVAPINEIRRTLYKSSAHFQREKYVFDIILPTFEKFQETKHLKKSKIFNHYPTIITSDCKTGSEYILLNDLTSIGYQNFERTKPLSYADTLLVLTYLAEFHAISYAMKDQNFEIFSKIVEQLRETIFVPPLHHTFDDFLKRKVQYALKTLTNKPEVGDDFVKAKLEKFRNEYGLAMIDCVQNKDDAVICHGDCWISNILYKKGLENFKISTKEIKFLDWQVTRYATPAIDLSYFIFCCTDTDLRDHLPDLLRKYHATLVKRINELGSDGKAIIPMEKLELHMKKYARFGFGMALMTLHSTCCLEKDLPDIFTALETTDLSNIDKYAKQMLFNPAYIKRMSDVCRDMVKYGYL